MINRVLIHRDAQAPQVIHPLRIARQTRPHHHDLRERPGLIEQLISRGTFFGVGQEHDVGLAGVKLLHALVARPEADLDRHAGFARERADQVNVEPFRLALVIQVLVGRKCVVAAVDERAGLTQRCRGRGGQREDNEGGRKNGPAAHGRILQGSGIRDFLRTRIDSRFHLKDVHV